MNEKARQGTWQALSLGNIFDYLHQAGVAQGTGQPAPKLVKKR